MFDSRGRLFGKISILDVLICTVVIVLVAGFLYGQVTEQIGVFVAPTSEFYVTFEANGLRPQNAEALSVGDTVFRRHDNIPFGVVTSLHIEQASAQMVRRDGTVEVVPVEGRYALFFTVRVTGSVTSMGYFVNGNDHVGVGSIVIVVSYRAYFPESEIIGITMGGL